MPEKNKKRTDLLAQKIIYESDICVRCGLCLPHCPTYLVSEIEPESPRGRIMMAQALADKKTPLTDSMQSHLENCLGCLACEAMCPAHVPYHDLLVNTRELLYQGKPKPIPFLLEFLLEHLRLVPLLQRLFIIYQKTGCAWVFKKTGITRLMDLTKYQQFMPKDLKVAKFRTIYQAQNPIGEIGLFLGCINQLCDARTIFHSISLLNALGYTVHIPKYQACCGAIHVHNGVPATAAKYAKKNRHCFENLPLDAICTLATGCNSSLQAIKDYSTRLKKVPIMDINEFLLQPAKGSLSITDHKKALLLHTPCTLKNSLKKAGVVESLLKKAGVTHIKHLQGYGCCGAAGLNMWNNPKLASTLAAPLIQQIITENPDYVVTSNIGCQLHLQQILAAQGQKTRVLHPINLLSHKKK